MYCKDGQHLRPVACPCMTVLVVVGDGGFAALRVGGYDVIDGCAETVTESVGQRIAEKEIANFQFDSPADFSK